MYAVSGHIRPGFYVVTDVSLSWIRSISRLAKTVQCSCASWQAGQDAARGWAGGERIRYTAATFTLIETVLTSNKVAHALSNLRFLREDGGKAHSIAD